MNRYEIRQDILKLVDQQAGNSFDIVPIIEKYTEGKPFDQQVDARGEITSVLKEMRDMGEISFGDLQISAYRNGEFLNSSGYIKGKLSRQKEKEQQQPNLHFAGYFQGNINTGNITGDLHQENNYSRNFDKKDEETLRAYGVEENKINELKEIISTTKDKLSLIKKFFAWGSSVSASFAARGLYEKGPDVMEYIHQHFWPK